MKTHRAVTGILAAAAVAALPAASAVAATTVHSATVSRNHDEQGAGATRAMHLEYDLKKATVTHAGKNLVFRWYVAKLSRHLPRPCVDFELETTPFSATKGYASVVFACSGSQMFVRVNKSTASGSPSGLGGTVSVSYAGNYVQWAGIPATRFKAGETDVAGGALIENRKETAFGDVHNPVNFTPNLG